MNEQARTLIAAIICDLAAYLNTLPDPIIIGGQYNIANSRLYKAIAQWTVDRNISLCDPDADAWFLAYNSGMFNGQSSDESN